MRWARTPLDLALAEEGLGRGQPDELHAFFLGVVTSRSEPGMLARSRR